MFALRRVDPVRASARDARGDPMPPVQRSVITLMRFAHTLCATRS